MIATTKSNSLIASLLDLCIAILNTNTAQTPQAKEVIGIMSTVLLLTRDKMVDNKDSAQLSEYCFNVCEALNNVVQGKNSDGFAEFNKTVMKDLERVVREIGCTLREGVAGTSCAKATEENVEGHLQKLQHILSTLRAPGLPHGEDAGGSSPHSVSVHPRTTSAYENAVCSPPMFVGLVRTLPLPELSYLAETISAREDEGGMARHITVGNAQTPIDVLDETLHAPGLSLQTRKQCPRLLYRICGQYTLLPKTLEVPVCVEQTSNPLYRGGCADVRKGEHSGQDVAIKVIRTYSNNELEKTINRFCKELVMWRFLRHPDILPLVGASMSENRFVMVSVWMRNGTINQFVKAHPDTNRRRLLVGAAKGLIYLHSNRMVHGDLKGAGMLVDEAENARLTDFGLLTILSDPANLLSSSSNSKGGRWMSPELIVPEEFGFEKYRVTVSSDCYALGIVMRSG